MLWFEEFVLFLNLILLAMLQVGLVLLKIKKLDARLETMDTWAHLM